jgi:hypothetical protein
LHLPVAVAMEGFNGHGRPLDRLVRQKGYRLFNVNNLKLARFKEVFPGAAKRGRLGSNLAFCIPCCGNSTEPQAIASPSKIPPRRGGIRLGL